MPRISAERKANVLKKLLPPVNMSVQELARSEGLPASTIYGWKREAKLRGEPVPGKRSTTEDWSAETKLATVIATGTLSDMQLSEYCRGRGLYPEQVIRWKQEALSGFALADDKAQSIKQTGKQDKKKIKRLESELAYKEKALAEAGAIIVLQKKYEAFLKEREAE